MESKIILEKDLKDKPVVIELPENVVYYIKLIGIGPKTLNESQGFLADIISKIDGAFIVASKDEMRKTLHNIIDMSYEDFERK